MFFVSIHAPLRGATVIDGGFLTIFRSFQSTRPCGARPVLYPVGRTQKPLFQSTRPCGARHGNGYGPFNSYNVSIHAPLRGATYRISGCFAASAVSIHAPLRGATALIAKMEEGKKCFNPRAPAGRDACMPSGPNAFSRFQSTRPCGARLAAASCAFNRRPVSIHAPLRGATAVQSVGSSRSRVSIHAPLRGATGIIPPEYCDVDVSIHAPLRGATCIGNDACKPNRRFNPRAPAGRDNSLKESFKAACVSIHAPLRGAT